jgi:hypothetical protein
MALYRFGSRRFDNEVSWLARFSRGIRYLLVIGSAERRGRTCAEWRLPCSRVFRAARPRE